MMREGEGLEMVRMIEKCGASGTGSSQDGVGGRLSFFAFCYGHERIPRPQQGTADLSGKR
jgi:hypothetical protein